MTARRGLDFEYAIKKDVRNNPIVREIDEERQRQLWRTAGISAVLVLVLLFSAWQTLELVLHGYEVQRLERERASEEEVNRHLRLEIETLRSPRRIEDVATKELKLVAPDRDEAIVIERVAPSTPPEKSIVALRGPQGDPEARRRVAAR
jgi:cell division protein FtsL